MKSKIGFLLFGGAFGFTSHYILNRPKPQYTISDNTRQLIDNYVNQNNLQQSYIMTIMKALDIMWKGFYHYGMHETLQCFNFNNLYIHKDQEEKDIEQLYCIFSPTNNICGHPQIQHGGATATLIDHNMGYLSIVYSRSMVATYKLNLKYTAPIKKDQLYVLKTSIEKRDGRSIYMKGTIKDLETGETKSRGEGHFMVVQWDHKLSRLSDKIFSKIHHSPQPHDQ